MGWKERFQDSILRWFRRCITHALPAYLTDKLKEASEGAKNKRNGSKGVPSLSHTVWEWKEGAKKSRWNWLPSLWNEKWPSLNCGCMARALSNSFQVTCSPVNKRGNNLHVILTPLEGEEVVQFVPPVREGEFICLFIYYYYY